MFDYRGRCCEKSNNSLVICRETSFAMRIRFLPRGFFSITYRFFPSRSSREKFSFSSTCPRIDRGWLPPPPPFTPPSLLPSYFKNPTVGFVTYLSQESLRGISSLGTKLGLWFKSLANLVKGWEPPMLEVLSLPLLVECSFEDSLVGGPESETRRSLNKSKERKKEEMKKGRKMEYT